MKWGIKMDVSFSVNQYDYEGDKFDDCILIHIDKVMILRFENVDQLEKFSDDLKAATKEIKEG
jgi:hypothetical protein